MFRILPLVIIILVVLVSVKSHNLHNQLSAAPAAQEKEDKQNDLPDDKELEGKKGKEKAEYKPPENNEAYKQNGRVYFSPAEIKVLVNLRQRRLKLESREENLSLKEDSLKVLARNIENRIGELNALEEKINKKIALEKRKENKKIDTLVKVYENMKPKDAARILEELQLDIAIAVVAKMKEARLAAVLSQMNPRKAQEITIELANKKRLDELK